MISIVGIYSILFLLIIFDSYAYIHNKITMVSVMMQIMMRVYNMK